MLLFCGCNIMAQSVNTDMKLLLTIIVIFLLAWERDLEPVSQE